jgi:aspartyl/asparaginyl-tRNA synthetase
MRLRRCVVGVVLASLAMAACGSLFATKVADILADPRKYDGQEVTVSGKVTRTTNLMFVKYFKVDDGSGEIVVVTKRPLPRQGEELRVKGKVNEKFAVGDEHFVVIEELEPQR